MYVSKTARVDPSAALEAPVRLYGSVYIHAGCSIGRFSFVNSRTTLHVNTTVGRYCSIGKNAEIGAPEHPLERLSTSPISYNLPLIFPDEVGSFAQVPFERGMPTTIGNDVWIGTGAVIRRGVTIGDGAVIGANAFVTQDVAPYTIVGGLPAAVIRPRFPEAVVAALLELQWWTLPTEALAAISFDDVEAAIAQLRKARGGKDVTRRDNVVALRRAIAAVPAHPDAAVVEEERRLFLEVLRSKLFDTSAPATLATLLEDNARKLFAGYDFEDEQDVQILNTKIDHIVSLATSLPGVDTPIPPGMQKTILAVMRAKS